MSYVLDGIKTAIDQDSRLIHNVVTKAVMGTMVTYECPCGWKLTSVGGDDERVALRFHYAHCPQAKVDP